MSTMRRKGKQWIKEKAQITPLLAGCNDISGHVSSCQVKFYVQQKQMDVIEPQRFATFTASWLFGSKVH